MRTVATRAVPTEPNVYGIRCFTNLHILNEKSHHMRCQYFDGKSKLLFFRINNRLLVDRINLMVKICHFLTLSRFVVVHSHIPGTHTHNTHNTFSNALRVY